MSNQAESTPRFIPYSIAMQTLRERHGATPDELAVWVMFGDAEGCEGLSAFREVNLSAELPRLEFDALSPDGYDYIAPLMGGVVSS